MRLVLAVTFLTFFGGVVRAVEDDDDDPKSSHSVVQPKAPPKVPPKVEPAAKIEPKAPVKIEPKAPARIEPKPEPPRPEPKAVAPKPEAKVEPTAVAKAEAKRPEKPSRPEPKAAALKVEPEPKAPEPKPIVDPFPPRNVRVRMLDGSNVSGTVRAELSESLVIDCNLGLLSIPRARIATISYDAGGGAKRAPVQQLDDDLPPKKR